MSLDPITCARCFQHKLFCLLRLLKVRNNNAVLDEHYLVVLGEHYLIDYYIRIEFQHRGSVHIHCLLWLNNALEFTPGCEKPKKECVKFIKS